MYKVISSAPNENKASLVAGLCLYITIGDININLLILIFTLSQICIYH